MIMAARSIDTYVIVVLYIIAQFKSITGILYQHVGGVGVLPSTETLSLPLWNSAFHQNLQQQQQQVQQAALHPNVLSAFDQSLLNVNNINKFAGFGSSLFSDSPNSAIFDGIKPAAELYDNDLAGYFYNGRFLKQYLVMEDNLDDINALDSFLSRFVPYVPTNYNVAATSRQPNSGFPTTAPTATPMPIQLGSGSLGYLRLPNGAVYLGSGSLGYTDDKQKANELSEVRSRQSPQASPLTFGESPQ